jgi:polygalacturonase
LPNINTANNFNVTAYGASTSSANNASDIDAAITAAAAASGGGTVEIPGPGVYLTGPLTMKSKVNLQIDAGAILRMLPYGTWSGTTPLLTSSSITDVELSGSGAIDGQGAPWWASDADSGLYMLYFNNCQRVLIENVNVSNAPAQQIVFKGSKTANVTIQGVTITAPDSNASSPSHNTDGIDLVGNTSLIQNCVISTGDDNIAMGSSSAPTYNTLITNCTFGFGHGVSIGSDTGGGVTNITVMNCTFNNTQNGIRMKSDSGKGGDAQYLYYYNLSMTNIAYAPILIYSYYNNYGNPTDSGITPAIAAGESTASTSGEPIWQDIIISNLTATAAQTGMIWAKIELPATNILLEDINITATGSFDLYNVVGVQIVNSQINPTDGSPTFALCNAQATFSNSVAGASAITLQGDDNTNSLAFYNAPASFSDSSMFDASPITIAGSAIADTTSLTLPSGTPVNFLLGTNPATVAVSGNLTLDSTINVTNAAGFTTADYTLFTYTGSLAGQPVLGTTPTGFPGYAYGLSTSTHGKVMLVVSAPGNNGATALQAALPGQTIQTNAGTGSVTGTPAAQTVGAPFNVVVNAVNANGELVTAASPTVNFTSTDGAASLPANGTTTLVNGTATVSVTFNSGGSQTLTLSDQANVLTAATSSAVTVNKAAPLLQTAPTASAIYNGQTLSASVLSGGACTNAEGVAVPGTFTFTSPGTAPPVGTASQSVTFTPANAAGYNTITLNVNVTVDAQTQSFVGATLTTSSNSPWTIPPGVTAIQVQMWGGGGGGGGVSVSTGGSYGAGGGGGGGAYTISTLTGLTPGGTIAFSVGASGAAGPSTGNANGGAGGNTTFAGAITANGGAGGGGTSTAGVAGAGGAGGTANAPGFKGGNGAAGGSTTSGGGGGSGGTNSIGNNASVATGGAAVLGGGAGANGLTGSTHANGNNGSSPGGGGSGGFENNGTTLRTGGAGGPGQIIIVNMSSPPTPPSLTAVSASGANLVITGANGSAGTCVVLMSTNLSGTSWTPVSTNTLSGGGNFSITVTNAIKANAAQQFYILQSP